MEEGVEEGERNGAELNCNCGDARDGQVQPSKAGEKQWEKSNSWVARGWEGESRGTYISEISKFVDFHMFQDILQQERNAHYCWPLR